MQGLSVEEIFCFLLVSPQESESNFSSFSDLNSLVATVK